MKTGVPSSGDLYEDLRDLLARNASSEEISRHLFYSILDLKRSTDPQLADMMLACAIPRHFDAEIIGIMRSAPEEREANERLLSKIAQLSFVLARKDGGGYVYHDNTRDMLLEDWRTQESGNRFSQLNERLVTFYEAKHRKIQELEQDLERVAPIVRRASKTRYGQLASAVESRLVTPLLEALYHSILISGQTGYGFFTRYCETYEQSRRLTICESLLSATRDYLKRLQPDNGREPISKWLRYWEGRLARQLGQNARAVAIMRDLDGQVKDDTKLKLWVLAELGLSLENQEKFGEAKKVNETALAIREQTGEDVWNLPNAYNRVASLYWTMGELDQAAERYRQAIESARNSYNSRMEAYSQLYLCGVLQDLGETDRALDMAIETLHLARSHHPQDQILHETVAAQCMRLFARQDPRLLDTVYQEVLTLATTRESFLGLTYRRQYVDMLQKSGQLRRADTNLTDLWEDVASYANTTFATEVVFEFALVRAEQGRVKEAIDHYTKVIERARKGRATNWLKAAAYSNRGVLYADRARWKEAKSDLRIAAKKWEEMGQRSLLALMQIFSANVSHHQGHVSRAQALLNRAKPVLTDLKSSYLTDYHCVQGDVYREQSRWDKARDHYEQALTIQRSLGLVKQSARTLGHLATIASGQGRWEEAAKHLREASALWERIAIIDRFQPAELDTRANEDNASGVFHFCQAGERRRAKVHQARDLFRSAVRRVPENAWYRLNLAFACAELYEWGEAAESLEIVLENGPTWLRCPTIEARLADYRLKHIEVIESEGDRLVREGKPDLALEQFTRELQLLSQAPPQDRKKEADIYGRMGFTHFMKGDIAKGRSNFANAIELYGRSGPENSAAALGSICSPLLRNIEEYWTLDFEWKTFAEEPGTNESLRADLLAARRSLTRYLDDLYRLPAQSCESSSMMPVVTPIAVEIGQDLIPEGPDTEWSLFKSYLPEMRARIRNEMGIQVPGVRIRGNEEDYLTGKYIIMLDEVPIVSGDIKANMRYCPASPDTLKELGIPEQDLMEASNPLTGEPGCWVQPDLMNIAASKSLEVWEDPLLYMVYHLEAVLRRNLADFLGIQAVDNLLWDWEQTERGSSLIKAVLPDKSKRFRFARVLRALVKERVSIIPWEDILEAVQGPGLASDDVSEVVRAVRFQLKRYLPGNNRISKHVQLPGEIEEKITPWIWRKNGKSFFAISPEETQELLTEIRELVNTRDKSLVLVTRSSELRPFVRRLVELEFPDLMVISREELLSEDELLKVAKEGSERRSEGRDDDAEKSNP